MVSVLSPRRLLAAAFVALLTVVSPVAVSAASAQPGHGHHHRHHHHHSHHWYCHHYGHHKHCRYPSRTSTTTGVGVTSHLVKVGARQIASVAVRGQGAKATGTVTIKVTGQRSRTVTLKGGRATFALPTKHSGIFEVTSSYRGSSESVASTSSSSYIVAGSKAVASPALRLASSPTSVVGGSSDNDGYSLDLLGLMGFGLASAAGVSTIANRRRSRAS